MKNKDLSFLQGGGEMGSLTRNYNWHPTSLGSPDHWPQSLRTTLSILLNSRFPMFLFWGPELTCFYNDAYRPGLGNKGKHPDALGKPGIEVWPEIWSTIKGYINEVPAGGEATWKEDLLLPIFTNGALEEVYWTFSYSPVIDESGEPGGVLVVCSETTEKVRNLELLHHQEKAVRSVFNQSPVAVAIYTGQDFIIELANEKVLEYLGRTLEQVINRPLFEALPEIAGLGFEEMLTAVLTTGERLTANEQSINLQRNGHLENTYVNFVFEPYRDMAGNISGVIVMANEVTQQVLSRKKTEYNENLLRSLIEASSVATCLLTGSDMRIEVANETALKACGKDRSVIGTPIRTVFPDMHDQPFIRLLDEVYATGISCSGKNAAAKFAKHGAAGDTAYFDFTYRPMFNMSGALYGVLITAIDVTEKVIVQQKIEQSEQNFRNLVMQAPVGICIVSGTSFIVEDINNSFLELIGRTRTELEGKKYLEVLPEAAAFYTPILLEVFNTGIPYRGKEHRVPLIRNGVEEVFYCSYVIEPIREGNAVTKIMMVGLDVTQQVIARIKTEEAEERARLAVESAELGTYEINLLTNNLRASPRMEAIFDVDHNADRMAYIKAIHPDDLKARNAAYKLAYKNGILDYDGRIMWKDGSVHWVRIKGKFYYNKENQPVHLVGVVQDITEQKVFAQALSEKVEERTRDLERANEHLAAINKELEQFTYAASHDMQEPLRKVQTFSSFLLTHHAGQLDERGKVYISKISTSVQRMKSIIDDLLNYSHQVREAQEFVATDLNKIIDDIETDLDLLIHQKEAVITRDTLPVITAVPGQMNQLFFNLFNNTLKFSRPQVPVRINIHSRTVVSTELPAAKGLDPSLPYVLVTFSDNGIGFEQEYAEQIFSLFKRLHGKSEYEGTGIGLGLCKKIVQNHKGAIWAEAETNKGATFFMLLPVNQ